MMIIAYATIARIKLWQVSIAGGLAEDILARKKDFFLHSRNVS